MVSNIGTNAVGAPSLRADLRSPAPLDGRTQIGIDEGVFSAPLGIHTKLHAILENKGLQPNLKNEGLLRRVERFALQDLVRSILKDTVQRGKKWAYVHRVNYCLRSPITKDKGISLFYNVEREQANFGNLQRCYSVWNCPICSLSITEGRRLELKQGLNNWINQSGFVYLVTFTNRHHRGDNLISLLNGQKKAFVKFWQKRKITEMLRCLGYKGRIVATEVTWGCENGWHPHYHMLFFFDHEINMQGLRTFLALEWQDVCKKVGLKVPDMEHGVDVQDGTYASEYVSKWGLEYEMTKGHTKKGLNGSLTPFDLLRGADVHEEYKNLFKEFADAFKGKQQLVWSKGLKSLLNIEQKTDEQIVDETEKSSIQVNELSYQIWGLILRYKKRPKILELVEYDYVHGTNLLDDFIMDLVQQFADEMVSNASG